MNLKYFIRFSMVITIIMMIPKMPSVVFLYLFHHTLVVVNVYVVENSICHGFPGKQVCLKSPF